MLEKDIEKKVYQYGLTHGIQHYKFSSPARAAVPDRIFMKDGVIIFIEFKRTGEKPTETGIKQAFCQRIPGFCGGRC